MTERRAFVHLVCACTIACGAPHGSDPAAESSELHASAVLRRLDGDGATIHPDGTATQNGVTYPKVVDGQPSMPWIATEQASGRKAIAFEVPTDTSGHKQRIEYKIARATDPDGLHFDDARYSGFAFKLGASPAPFRGTAIFWQAWQGYPYGPPVSLKFESGSAPPYRIRLCVRNPKTGPDSKVPDIEVWSDAVIQPDEWRTFLIYVEPRWDGGGHVKLWIDGTRVVEWTGAIGYEPRTVQGALPGLDLKNGIYQPTANDGHTFYFDRIVVTKTYAAAAGALGWP